MSLGYGLGVGGGLRDWASFEGKKILELLREAGDSFFGVFFSGACIVTMGDTLAEFCRGKLHEQIAWFRGLVTWLFTSGGLLFLCICTVLHACFAKPFFERIPNSTVEEAYVHVHKIANELEMYANDVQLAQKEAERVAEQMGGRGAPASSQSTRSRKPNPKIFGPEF